MKSTFSFKGFNKITSTFSWCKHREWINSTTLRSKILHYLVSHPCYSENFHKTVSVLFKTGIKNIFNFAGFTKIRFDFIWKKWGGYNNSNSLQSSLVHPPCFWVGNVYLKLFLCSSDNLWRAFLISRSFVK